MRLFLFVLLLFTSSCVIKNSPPKSEAVAKQDLFDISEGSKGHKAPSASDSLIEKIKESDGLQKQEFDRGKITFLDDDNPSRFPTKIKFGSGKIVDLCKTDPYLNLPFDKIEKEDNIFEHLYDLSNLSRSEQNEILENTQINKDAFRNSDYLKIYSKMPVIQTESEIAAVAYHIDYYSNEEDILANQGEVHLYDGDGELLRIIKDDKNGFYDIRLSKDGKHLMQQYGTSYGEDGTGVLPTGFKFYDINTGDLIFEWKLGKDEFLSAYGFIDEQPHLATALRMIPGNFEYLVFNVKSKMTYTFKGTLKQFNDSDFMRSLFTDLLKNGDCLDLIKLGFIKNT